MAQQALATKPIRETAPAIRVGTLRDEIRQRFDSVARRAFEIFEFNGRIAGQDVEDWLRAERELFHPAFLVVSESAEGFTVRAEVPGFAANELEVNIEGRRLTISGKRETYKERKDEKTIYSERPSDQVLRVVDLPADIKMEEAKAALKDGILEFEVPKAAAAKQVSVESKAA